MLQEHIPFLFLYSINNQKEDVQLFINSVCNDINILPYFEKYAVTYRIDNNGVYIFQCGLFTLAEFRCYKYIAGRMKYMLRDLYYDKKTWVYFKKFGVELVTDGTV